MVDVPIEPSEENEQQPASGSRRAFLAGAGAAAAVAGLTAACSPNETAAEDPIEAPPTPHGAPPSGPLPTEPTVATPVSFFGQHQGGVLLDSIAAGLVASFDVTVADRAALIGTLQALSTEIERLMGNRAIEPADGFLPPADSGIVDSSIGTTGVGVTLAVGSTLFDGRFGLSDQRPRELIPMPRFFNDRLVREDLSGGDLSVTITAPDQQTAVFALHQIVRVTDRQLRVRWVQEGYNQILPERPGQIAHSRNLMGFRDGTSNLDAEEAETMRDFVWVQPGDDEPEWAVGGTYQAARIIRMLIEFWATAALVRQEQIFGRHRDTGAPLGQQNEGDEPTFVSNPADDAIPQRAHMRLANPRTPGTGRILRRGFSYLNGADVNGTLDQGLLFLCYQRALSTGFFEVQTRLDGEPLEDYVKPVGGGLFFVLPGPAQGGWLGESMLS